MAAAAKTRPNEAERHDNPADPLTGETLYQYLERTATQLEGTRPMTVWQALAKTIAPRAMRTVGEQKDTTATKLGPDIFNNTATLAARTAQAGLMSGNTSPSRPWFQLRTPDSKLNKVRTVRIWLDEVRQRMVEIFLKSNLYTVLPLVYYDLLIFGTSAFALMEDDEDTIRAYHMPIGTYALRTGYRGNVNGCYRSFTMSVEQLVRRFGLENCSPTVQDHFRSKRFDVNIKVRHAVEENPNADASRLDSKFLPFRSIYYEIGNSNQRLLSVKGTHDLCVIAPRWQVNGEDSWGFGLGHEVLGDAKQLQVQEKRKLQLLEMITSPPRSVPAGLRDEFIGTMANEFTFVPDTGGNGPKVEPNYVPEPNFQHLALDIQNTERRIKRGMFEDLFLMFDGIDKSGVTATEIQARQQEKMMVMGPVLERLNDEMLDPIVKRTFGIMERAGLLPVPPQELQDQPILVEYISIMAQAMKLNGVVSVERFVSFVGGVGNTRPDALDKLNTDETIDVYADMVGVPPQMVNDEKIVKQIRTTRAKQQQAQEAMVAAQQMATTAKTMADTDTSTPSMLQAMSGASGFPTNAPFGGQ